MSGFSFSIDDPNFDLDDPEGLDFGSDVQDDLLDMDGEVQPDMTPEMPEQLNAPDFTVAAPLRQPDDSEVVFNVEDTLLELMAQGRRKDILALTGESPELSGQMDEAVLQDFGPLYTRAVTINPALKWYAKFVKVLPPSQFGLTQDRLVLSMSQDVFKKIVVPFLGDFDPKMADTSPIVGVVVGVVNKINGQHETIGLEEATRTKRRASHDRSAFDPGDVDFGGPDTFENEDVHEADMGLFDDMFGMPEAEESAASSRLADMHLSLSDLSTKAVAEYLDSEGLADTDIETLLDEQGFNRARRNEIAAVVRYMRLDKAQKLRGNSGNRGGDVDFPFG